MVIAAVCWVVVLAFGPKTMTHTNQTTEKEKSAERASEASRVEREKAEKAVHEAENWLATQANPTVTTPTDTDTLVPEVLNPQIPEPIIQDEVMPKPLPQQIVPKPELPKYPPVCGGCGRVVKDNGLTIQCPMYEMLSSYVCAM